MSEDLNGDEIEGYYTVLYRDGTAIDTDFTPAEFTLEDDVEYEVEVQDFEEYVFDHWEDTGSSSRDRTVSITSDAELTAVYRNTEDPSESEDEEIEEEEREDENDDLAIIEEEEEQILTEEQDAVVTEEAIDDSTPTDDETEISSEPTTPSSDDCFEYDAASQVLNIVCDANLADASDIGDGSTLQALGSGEYLLNANVTVSDNATLNVGGEDFGYLKIADEKGITVFGAIEIEDVTITSWDTEAESVIDIGGDNPNLPRAYLSLIGSEGGHIVNSTVAHMGYNDTGYRGIDLLGGSHDFVIRNSTFHDMWYAFYSNGAYNITIDSSEYRDNMRYAIDPHTGTHNMSITNNHVYNNSAGVICSLDCHDILFEGNTVHSNDGSGILFSRNTTDSAARYNTVYNQTDGIVLSESPSNEVYGNNITNVTRGIYLINPHAPDDGFTTLNHIYNNTIGDAQYGMVARRSEGNILSDNSFAGNVSIAHYFLNENSTIGIMDQVFSDTEIRGRDGQNAVAIANSGLIAVGNSTADTDASTFTRVLTNQTLRINSVNGEQQ